MRILVVDDNKDIVDTLARVLIHYGNEVEVARNGGEAIFKMTEFRPELVVLDLMMPVINGWEFLDTKKGLPDFSSIPVVVMSGYAELPQPLTPDVKEVIPKPVDSEVLLESIDKALNQSRR